MKRVSSLWRSGQSLLLSTSRNRCFTGTLQSLPTNRHQHMATMASPMATKTPKSYGNFDLVKRMKLDFTDVTVSKWRSRESGLSVVHLDYEAPLVNGYFVVATEIFNDSGCPHTLEHLVFMGSEKYPYKGIIDHFANRGFSNGTNAWTDTDHTAYTVSTAGSQGFLQILPIYIDHILYPTMTKSAFLTEVHHIDPKGHDSGVVYSEMQGRQNTSGDLMNLILQRLLDRPGSAYRSETGGLMEALRVLTVEQIRDYHGSYYLPHNLSLIITGKLAHGTESLLSVVQEQVEPTIVAHNQNKGPRPQGWKRPFVETASADRRSISSTIKETVEFPEKDESVGELLMGFMGPPPGNYLERKALDVLGTYLTSSAVAPLNKEYIETESPLCTYIYFGEETRATFVDLPIYIGSVPTEHIDTFDEKLRSSFKRIVKEGFDMTRMEMVISRDERQLRSKLESDKGDTFSGTVISDFLYGAEDGSELHTALDEIQQYATLRKWTNEDWTSLMKKYFIDANYVAIRGKPSATLAEKLEKDEKARTADQVARLGPEGLSKLEQELEEAKAENNRPIPSEVLNKFPVPDVKSISWINVQSVQQPGHGRQAPASQLSTSPTLAEHLNKDGEPLPFFVQYDHVQSDFVSIHAFISLADLPDRLRPHVSTYLNAFFSLPVKRRTGAILSHEEVVNKLDDETVSYEVSLGVSNYFSETFRISIKVEVGKYETAIAWLYDLLYGVQFNKERLQVTLAKIQQSLPELKRDGNTVLGSVWSELVYNKSSTSRSGGIITQMEFVPKLAQELQDSPDTVISDFEEIRRRITQPSGVRFSVTGNILGIPEPRNVWRKYFSDSLPASPLSPVPLASSTLSEIGRSPSKKAVVMSLSTIESSYVQHSCVGPQGFNHAEYPAVRVALEVLNATESYLWRYIRGSGLAYGAYVGLDVEAGFLSFTLYRSSNPLSAYQQGAQVVKGLVDGSIVLDDTTLATAKSSIVYSVAKGVSTAGRAAMTSFTNQALKGVPQDHQIDLLSQYAAVTPQDVLAAMKKYFLPLFDPEQSVAVVISSPSMVDPVVDGLQAHGFNVERQHLEVDDGDEGESSSESGIEESDEEE